MFMVAAKVNAGGPATLTATVTSPDSNPNTVSASTTVNALTKHSLFPGFLSHFGFGPPVKPGQRQGPGAEPGALSPRSR